mmetsp:Transcript_968/g.1486  ORF Transcript_968/g.1486 Transcript_968/m.1486 type:complete len:107 (+) Transcript_968:1440-1760(+)
MSSEEWPKELLEETKEAPSFSCVSAFDALYFCYTPGYQLTNYYRTGRLESCQQTLRDFFFCLSCKWTSIKDPTQAKVAWEDRIKPLKVDPKQHVWEFKDNVQEENK